MLLYAFMIIYANLAISTSSANWQPSVARVPALRHQAAPVVMLPVVPKSGLNWLSGTRYDVVIPPLFPGNPFFIHTYKVCLYQLADNFKGPKGRPSTDPFCPALASKSACACWPEVFKSAWTCLIRPDIHSSIVFKPSYRLFHSEQLGVGSTAGPQHWRCPSREEPPRQLLFGCPHRKIPETKNQQPEFHLVRFKCFRRHDLKTDRLQRSLLPFQQPRMSILPHSSGSQQFSSSWACPQHVNFNLKKKNVQNHWNFKCVSLLAYFRPIFIDS